MTQKVNPHFYINGCVIIRLKSSQINTRGIRGAADKLSEYWGTIHRAGYQLWMGCALFAHLEVV